MSEATEQTAIELIGVTKTFDRGLVHALDNVSLTIRAREWVALTGPSGSGKSTLLHLLAALDEPTAGQIVVNGRRLSEVSNINDYRRHEVGLVFQLHNLLPNLNAIQNVEIAMLGTGTGHREGTERAHALLSDVGLTARETLRPPELSGGERQRVAIARALANGPSILLADEPTGSLDSSSAASVLELFARIRNDRKLTILLVTHDAQVATAADRVVLMRDGKVVDSPNGITGISPKTGTHV